MDRLTRTLSKAGAVAAGALVIATMAAGGAQAVSISPGDTQITATADNPTFNYGTRVWTCDSSTAIGTTGTDSHVVLVDIEFQEPCSQQPLGLSATIECNDGEFAELEATDGDTNQGVVDELHEGFECRLAMGGICAITIAPQDLPLPGGSNDADLLNEGSGGSEAINADVDIHVSNNNSLCGPVPSGTAGLAAVYNLDAPVTFDP